MDRKHQLQIDFILLKRRIRKCKKKVTEINSDFDSGFQSERKKILKQQINKWYADSFHIIDQIQRYNKKYIFSIN